MLVTQLVPRPEPSKSQSASELVVRGGVEPPTFRFSGLRITVQDWPRMSLRLLSDLRCTPINAGALACIED